MTMLPDNTSISQLSIPGTHNSCSLYGTVVVETQKMSLREQLDAGIRFLDIRARHFENSFSIHHEMVYQNIRFGKGVRNVVVDWLIENPGETVIMSIRNEHTEMNNNRTFEDTFKWYTGGFYRNFWSFGDTIPNLGDVRGKIVLFRRFKIQKRTSLGIDMSIWPDDRTFNKLPKLPIVVQDKYKIPISFENGINGKWEASKELLDAARDSDGKTWYINFLSAYSLLSYPGLVSKGFVGYDGMNSRLLKYMEEHPTGNIGTVLMDYPESEKNLIPKIISRNFDKDTSSDAR